MLLNYFPLEWKHAGGSKGDRFDFRIDCHRKVSCHTSCHSCHIDCNHKCRNIDIVVNHASGDVDLYGEQKEVPNIV